LERTGLVQVYSVDQLKAYRGPNTEGPKPIAILTNGDKIKDGNEIEPACYSRSGRFLVHDGDTRVSGDSEGIFPGYLRIVETKEIQDDAPMPDPVFVQRIQATEFIDFSPDDSLLASGHGDGTARLWNVTISGTETIASEAFNESNPGRWKLSGKVSDTQHGWGSSSQVMHKTAFRGHRGLYYLAAKNLGGETHALELNEAWDIGQHKQRGLQFVAVATPGTFEEGDFLRLLADLDADGQFETKVVEFLPDSDGDLALAGSPERKLNSVFLDDDGKKRFYSFEDYFLDLERMLPAGFAGRVRFRVEASTDSDNEEIGFDSLRVTGKKAN